MSATLIQRQLDAYNAHDIPALLACYAHDAKQSEFPHKLLRQGHDAIAQRMHERFADSSLRAELLQRMCMADMVIDHERLHFTEAGVAKTTAIIAIYQIQNQLIQHQWIKFS
ncbi:MAG: hypothetical protein RLZZ502_173 [Pseudomonadota bacterium]|jgi:hypothetical protein